MIHDRIWILLTRKLSGEATATELQELSLSLEENANAAKAVQELSFVWSLNPKTDKDFLEATYLQHLERMKTKGIYLSADEPILNTNEELIAISTGHSFSFKKMINPLVALLFLAGLWILYPSIKNSPAKIPPIVPLSEVLTPNGSRTRILLPDGSNVWLNSGSKLTYNKSFKTGLREVYLSGEAFFDVVKNTKQPFIIHTSQMDVRVLGTQFNVKAYDQDKTFETSLIHGSVEVFLNSNPREKYLLKPNQKLVLQHKLPNPEKTNKTSTLFTSEEFVQIRELTYLAGANTAIESSWTKNILSFQDEPFSEVAKKMERWYDVTIQFKNKEWEHQFLSGSFEKESLEQALKALKFSTGFNFKINDKIILIY